jgi:hypothetical protein
MTKYFYRKSIFFQKKLHISPKISTFVAQKAMKMMKIRYIYTLLIISCVTNLLLAQDDKNTLPDLQMANTNFFDPTLQNDKKEEYHFAAPWRFEAGYVQLNQKQDTSASYLHGLRFGATVDFILPHRFSLQTGAIATLVYRNNNQHWASLTEETAQINIMQHNILQLQLTIPARAYYNIVLWKKLRLFFYAGPQLQIGLTSYDIINTDKMSSLAKQWLENQGIPTKSYDRYATNELYRTNIQFGLGGGLEWDRYRLQAGYDFGLNNIFKTPILPKQTINEWGWMCTFSYLL